MTASNPAFVKNLNLSVAKPGGVLDVQFLKIPFIGINKRLLKLLFNRIYIEL